MSRTVYSVGEAFRVKEDARGPKVDGHCPYDEAQLRAVRSGTGFICPCCWSQFAALATPNAIPNHVLGDEK